MDNSFKSVIDGSKSVLVLLPTRPYFDQVASALSLFLAFRDQKDITVYTPSPMTVEYNRLIGVNKISQELGNKNLVIRFADYKATDIERVSYDIENSQFRLTVIPKQKVTPPTKDQIELSYSGISSDTVVIIGGANETHFPALSGKELSSANIVHVGIRDISLASNKNYVSFSRPASSISEIVYDLVKDSGANLDSDVATNLLMGIEEATGNLTDPAVTADTFMTVAELMKAGGKRLGAQGVANRQDFPVGAVPGDLDKRPVTPNPRPFIPSPRIQENKSNDNISQKVGEENESPKDDDKAPDDWLQPKIYKGTSIS